MVMHGYNLSDRQGKVCLVDIDYVARASQKRQAQKRNMFDQSQDPERRVRGVQK